MSWLLFPPSATTFSSPEIPPSPCTLPLFVTLFSPLVQEKCSKLECNPSPPPVGTRNGERRRESRLESYVFLAGEGGKTGLFTLLPIKELLIFFALSSLMQEFCLFFASLLFSVIVEMSFAELFPLYFR